MAQFKSTYQIVCSCIMKGVMMYTKSPEQAPQTPLVGTEFLRTVDTKPPQNRLSLHQTSFHSFVYFCAITDSQKLLFFLAIFGGIKILSKHSKPFYCIISLSSHSFTHLFVNAPAARSTPRFASTNTTKQPCRSTYDASTTTTTAAASPVAAGHRCHGHDRPYGTGHRFKTSKLYSNMHQ